MYFPKTFLLKPCKSVLIDMSKTNILFVYSIFFVEERYLLSRSFVCYFVFSEDKRHLYVKF